MSIPCRRVHAALAGPVATVLLMVWPALGQVTTLQAPENSVRGEPVNVFASWAGDESADGFLLELPSGWGLDSATVLRNGYHRVAAQSRRLDDLLYRVDLSESLEAPHDVVLHIRPGDGFAQDRIVLTPVTRNGNEYVQRTAFRAERRLRVIDRPATRTNRVLSFTGTGPLELHPARTPDLALDRPFAVSFWLKSTALDEVVLSTWNGDDRRTYPLEVVVDAAGHLRVFRGRPGEHQSLVSHRPVADGSWHLISFSNHPDEGWARLALDGRTIDSLYAATPLRIGMELPLVLGGRVDGPAAYFDRLTPFTGSIDELRIETIEDPPLHLDFEEASERDFGRAIPGDPWARPISGVRYEWDDVHLHDDVETFQAVSRSDGVTLTWSASSPRTRAFVVERSSDGRLFEDVERVEPSQSGTYSVRDDHAGDGVVFYRLRQLSTDAGEIVSGTLRVGRGAEELAPVVLLGNFPNPFNATTTITYQVREAARIHLAIWDLSGQPVATLVDQIQSPGVYEPGFDAGDLPSGTYFVRLHTPQGTASHKMILMK